MERRQACQVAGGGTNLGDRCAQLDELREEEDWREDWGAGELPFFVTVRDGSVLECLTGDSSVESRCANSLVRRKHEWSSTLVGFSDDFEL